MQAECKLAPLTPSPRIKAADKYVGEVFVMYDSHIDRLLLGIMLKFSGRLSLLSNVLSQSCSEVTSMNYLLVLSCDLDERSEKSNPITHFGTGVALLCHSYVDYFQVG